LLVERRGCPCHVCVVIEKNFMLASTVHLPLTDCVPLAGMWISVLKLIKETAGS